jgi:endonuclease/exonuclease/phosphatase (EEP) superfamily protein YafD
LHPNDPGYTWPLFGEDQFQNKVQGPYERIDLIFSRGLSPVSVRRLSYGAFWGPCASDHTGVIATLQFDN